MGENKAGREKMLKFLDADDFNDKMDILRDMYIQDELDDFIIDSLSAALDYVIEEGDLQIRYEQLRRLVETRAKYEGGRLRRS